MPENLSIFIKEKARELGFSHCGIAKAAFLENEKEHLADWLASGKQAGMAYMENYFEKRLDPTLLVEKAQSVIVLAFNYFPKEKLHPDSYKISRYAYGDDYHTVLQEKLTLLIQAIREKSHTTHIRSFVDSAPVLERAWAVKAGLGWIGKNSMLIIPKKGSFFFLAEILLDLPLDYDAGFTQNRCGNCRRCMDACPTQAIVSEKTVDARRCISYLTIENKGEIPAEFRGRFENQIFGCDICQEVCPWNRFASFQQEAEFFPSEALQSLTRQDWETLTEADFSYIFRNSSIKRAKFAGLKRNINFVKN